MKCNSIKSEYIKLNKQIHEEGIEVYKDNKLIKEILGVHRYIDDPLNFCYKEIYRYYTPEKLLETIKKGNYNVPSSPVNKEMLHDYVASFEDSALNGFVYSYPNRLLEHFGINQFNQMKRRLLDDLWTNRAVATTYDVKNDANKTDIPCLQFLQATIRDNGKLTLHVFFRSNDVYGAFYSNMFFITYIGLKLQYELNKELINDKIIFDGIHYYCSSCHVYKTDLKASKNLVQVNR